MARKVGGMGTRYLTKVSSGSSWSDWRGSGSSGLAGDRVNRGLFRASARGVRIDSPLFSLCLFLLLPPLPLPPSVSVSRSKQQQREGALTLPETKKSTEKYYGQNTSILNKKLNKNIWNPKIYL